MPNSATITMLCILAFMGFLSLCECHNTFYVGDEDGWVPHPRRKYDNWAGAHRFQINDQLVFKYEKGEDSVLVVNGDDYESCNRDDPIKVMKNGDSLFRLNRSGIFYFISGHDQNCEKGQKFVLVVLADRHRRPPPAHSPSPAHVAPANSPAHSPSPVHVAPARSPAYSPSSGHAGPVKSPAHSPSPAHVAPAKSPAHSPSPVDGAPARSPAHSPSPPHVAPAKSPAYSPSSAHAGPVKSPAHSPSPAHVAPAKSPAHSPSPVHGAPPRSPAHSPSQSHVAPAKSHAHSPSPVNASSRSPIACGTAESPAHPPVTMPISHPPSPSPVAKSPAYNSPIHSPSPSPQQYLSEAPPHFTFPGTDSSAALNFRRPIAMMFGFSIVLSIIFMN